MTGTPIIALWAVPRSRSTAFERMLVERGDLEVVHEPFSYLSQSGSFTIGDTTATSVTALFDLLLAQAAAGRRLFFKETTDYTYDSLLADSRLYRHVTNTFLIRDPDAVIASYHAMKPAMTLDEVGFDRLYQIFRAVADTTGEQPVVIDADDLMRSPEEVVGAWCRRVGLDVTPGSLRWDAGARPEWGPTDAWHRDVSTSTGFVDFQHTYAAHPGNDPWLAEVAAYHRPFYDRMYADRVTAEQAGADIEPP